MGADNLCHLAGCSAEQWALQHPDLSIMALTASTLWGEPAQGILKWQVRGNKPGRMVSVTAPTPPSVAIR